MPDLKGRYQSYPEAWKPAERPATLGEVWDASRTLAAIDNSNANDVRMEDAYRGVVNAINAQRKREGLPAMANPVYGIRATDPRSIDPSASAYGVAPSVKIGQDAAQREVFAELRRIRQRQPDFLKDAGDDPAAFMKRADEGERARRDRARGVLDRSSGIASTIVGFAGGVSKAMEDPINIATLPIGGGGRTIVGVMAREAILNGAIEALSQPQAARNRAAVGEDLTAGEAALNIAAAGVGAGAIAGGIHGLGRSLGPAWDGGMRRVFDALPEHWQEKWASLSSLPDEALPTIADSVIGRDRFTPEMAAAVHVAQRHGDIMATSPFAPGGRNADAHADRLAETLAAIMDGAPAISPRSRLSSGTTLASGDFGGRMAGAPTQPAMGGYMRAVRAAESSGVDTAAARTSSAYGRYQFTRGTWLRYYVKAFGRQGLSDAEILAKRADGALQDRLVQDLARDNAAALRRAGHEPTNDNLYLMHFAGPGDGIKLLDAPGSAMVRDVMRAESVKANPHLRNMTVRDVREWAARKVGGAGEPVRVAVADGEPVRFDDLDADEARLLAEDMRLADGPGDPAARAGSAENPTPDMLATRAHRPPRDIEEATARFGERVERLRTAALSDSNVAWDARDYTDRVLDQVMSRAGLASREGGDVTAIAQAVASDPALTTVLREEIGQMLGDDAMLARARADRPEIAPEDLYAEIDAMAAERGWTPEQGTMPPQIMAVANPVTARARILDRRAAELRAERATADLSPIDDYDQVAPFLAEDMAEVPAHRLDADDAIWDAIDALDAERGVAASAASAPIADPAMRAFDEPGGVGATAQTESLFHDLRQMAEADPARPVRISEDGEARPIAEVLDELDEDDAAIAAVKGCL